MTRRPLPADTRAQFRTECMSCRDHTPESPSEKPLKFSGAHALTLKLLSSDTETMICVCHGQNSAAVTGPRWPFSTASVDWLWESL